MVLYGLLWPYYCVLWPFMAKYRSDWTCIVLSRGHRSKFIWSCFYWNYYTLRLSGENFRQIARGGHCLFFTFIYQCFEAFLAMSGQKEPNLDFFLTCYTCQCLRTLPLLPKKICYRYSKMESEYKMAHSSGPGGLNGLKFYVEVFGTYTHHLIHILSNSVIFVPDSSFEWLE